MGPIFTWPAKQYTDLRKCNQTAYLFTCTSPSCKPSVCLKGSRSTFEFPSRVNLSGPSLYCVVKTLGK